MGGRGITIWWGKSTGGFPGGGGGAEQSFGWWGDPHPPTRENTDILCRTLSEGM